jgi:hypothetical protein
MDNYFNIILNDLIKYKLVVYCLLALGGVASISHLATTYPNTAKQLGTFVSISFLVVLTGISVGKYLESVKARAAKVNHLGIPKKG